MTGALVIALDRTGRLQTARWNDFVQFERTSQSSKDPRNLHEAGAGAKSGVANAQLIHGKDHESRR